MALALAICMSGFAVGAFASSTSGWINWKKFDSSGVNMCANHRASVNANSSYGVHVTGYERAENRSGTTCGTNRGRAYDNIRVIGNLWKGSWKVSRFDGYNTTGEHVADIDFNYIGPGYNSGCFRLNVVGRQWDADVAKYLGPTSPAESGQDCVSGIGT